MINKTVGVRNQEDGVNLQLDAAMTILLDQFLGINKSAMTILIYYKCYRINVTRRLTMDVTGCLTMDVTGSLTTGDKATECQILVVTGCLTTDVTGKIPECFCLTMDVTGKIPECSPCP